MKPFKLDQQPKINTGFKIPDGYFEDFEASVMQQLQPQPKVIKLKSKPYWWYAAAAVLAVSLSIPAVRVLTSTKNQPDESALENYFAYTNIPEEQLVELLEKEDIEKIQIDYQLEDAAIEEALPAAAIENYIID